MQKRWNYEKKQKLVGFSFVLPWVIGFGVFTAFLIAFVTLWLMDVVEWRLFLFALSAAILAYMIMICIFKRTRQLQYVIALFVASLFVIVYFFLPTANPWQLFLILIPAEAIVFLACNVKKRRHPHPKKQENK